MVSSHPLFTKGHAVNIANQVTLARIIGAGIVLVILSLDTGGAVPAAWQPGMRWAVVGLFVAAALTDALDGYLARSRNLVTVFGRIADPFADKLLVTGTLVLLTALPGASDVLRPWMVVVVLVREFLVSGIRGVLESEGINFQAAATGKLKMVVQVMAVTALLIRVAAGPAPWLTALATLLVAAMLVLAVVSGYDYVRRGAVLLRRVPA